MTFTGSLFLYLRFVKVRWLRHALETAERSRVLAGLFCFIGPLVLCLLVLNCVVRQAAQHFSEVVSMGPTAIPNNTQMKQVLEGTSLGQAMAAQETELDWQSNRHGAPQRVSSRPRYRSADYNTSSTSGCRVVARDYFVRNNLPCSWFRFSAFHTK